MIRGYRIAYHVSTLNRELVNANATTKRFDQILIFEVPQNQNSTTDYRQCRCMRLESWLCQLQFVSFEFAFFDEEEDEDEGRESAGL